MNKKHIQNANENYMDFAPLINFFEQVLQKTGCEETYLSHQVFSNPKRYEQIKNGSELLPATSKRAWASLEYIEENGLKAFRRLKRKNTPLGGER